MTNKISTTDDQFLRRAFDTFYTLTAEDVRRGLAKTLNQLGTTRLGLIFISIGALLLLIVTWVLATNLINTLTSPTMEQRLLAPYALDSRLPAIVDTTTTTLLPPTIADYTLKPLAEADTLLGQCLQSAAITTETHCAITTPALYTEVGQYQRADGSAITIVATQYVSGEEAERAIYEAYQYGRAIGRIGNFAFLDSAPVDYFYSSTRESFAFTWSQGTWVYTIANDDLERLEDFIAIFPY